MKITYVNCGPASVGLLAQLVERCTDIAKVMGSNPVQAWILLVFINAKLSFKLIALTAVHIYGFCTFSFKIEKYVNKPVKNWIVTKTYG